MQQLNNGQQFLKLLLITQVLALLIYTGFAVNNEGWNLFNTFVANISSLNWSGQFNLDFSCYLTLSGIWIMWRNKFSTLSILIGITAMILGIIFFGLYLVFLISLEKGDIKKVLIANR
jgi:hypothetical protein